MKTISNNGVTVVCCSDNLTIEQSRASPKVPPSPLTHEGSNVAYQAEEAAFRREGAAFTADNRTKTDST